MLMGLPAERVGELVSRSDMLPLASEHGGFLFSRTDATGFIAELHTLFMPEGWGREALSAGVQSLGVVWALGFQLVGTFEAEANLRSRPPRTFGFRQCGDWRATPIGALRLWTLSLSDWTNSPARRLKCLH